MRTWDLCRGVARDQIPEVKTAWAWVIVRWTSEVVAAATLHEQQQNKCSAQDSTKRSRRGWDGRAKVFAGRGINHAESETHHPFKDELTSTFPVIS